jgi:hypothetical protein
MDDFSIMLRKSQKQKYDNLMAQFKQIIIDMVHLMYVVPITNINKIMISSLLCFYTTKL